jgi:hypothetical protein
VRQRRGVSQILFGFLPDQTVDLENAVWQVVEWSEPRYLPVDTDVLRRDLLRTVYPWSAQQSDHGLADALHSGVDIDVVSPSERGGVEVRSFPEVYRCRACGRVRVTNENLCACGKRSWAQMPFVGFHKCGRLEAPWIRRCPQHDDVMVRLAGSATARDLKFECPVCHTDMGGFPYLKCDCQYAGTLSYNIHRAAVVYTPRNIVMVNPPNAEIAAQLRASGAAEMALGWVLDGMKTNGPLDGKPSLASLTALFVGQGIPEDTAQEMAQAAAAKAGGAVTTGSSTANGLTDEAKSEAEEAAVKLAFAVAGGRTRLEQLEQQVGPESKQRYQNLYRPAISSLRLDEVELLENFPILTAMFGYTRGEAAAGASTLRWFRSSNGGPAIHGFKSDTEGLLFRLNPVAVAAWLERRGFLADAAANSRDARLQLLGRCEVPRPGEVVDPSTPGAELLTLIHSLSHRVIRRISAFSGIERDALGEYLVPLHLAFVVFASSRGDFVLGGLQALFEHDLDKALRDVLGGESRCALDPGCTRHGGACVACLHVGEPTCRFYNQFLDRRALFGRAGLFLSANE